MLSLLVCSKRDYSNFFLGHQNYNYFYIDECGFSLNTTRRVARVERCQKAAVHKARNKGRNTSVVACVNKDIVLVTYDYKDGSINSEDFISFLNIINGRKHYMHIKRRQSKNGLLAFVGERRS